MPDDDRAKQLAKDILDELDKPTSPERLAQQAQKEREDREALERFYIATGQIKPEQVMQRALAELADKIERMTAPATDLFELPIEIKGRKGTLRFAPSPTKPEHRHVEISIYSDSGLSTSSQVLESGTREALVVYLRRPEVITDTLHTVDELKESLGRNRLA